MFQINTTTKKFTEAASLNLGQLPTTDAKIDFRLNDGSAPVIAEGKTFEMTIGTVQGNLYKTDGDTVSFRYLKFDDTNVSATPAIVIKMEGVEILNDTISLTYQASGEGGASGAAWGQITGSLQDQSDLNIALAGKISFPSGGSTGQFLQKTATGVQWATVQGGGDTPQPTPTITAPSSQSVEGTQGEELAASITTGVSASNGSSVSYSVKQGSALPAGLALSATGDVTGTPTAAGSTTTTVVLSAEGCDSVEMSVSFAISEAAASDGFPKSFTVSSVIHQDQDKTAPCGTYTRTGEAFPLTAGSVTYPVYSYMGTDSNTYYICVVANMYGGDGPAWMLTATKPTASSVTSALAITGYGGTTLKSGSYEPADTQWTGNNGNAVVSWEMGNAGTAALTAKAFGHPTWRIATQFSAVLQKYTYTGTFTVNGETFPYYTGNGSTPWYLFGGKARANTGSSTPWFYAVYLSSKNPTTISSWAGLEFTWGVSNNTRLIMAGGAVESTGPAPTYSEISSELSTTLLNSNKWWYVDDSDYPSTEQADTITWE